MIPDGLYPLSQSGTRLKGLALVRLPLLSCGKGTVVNPPLKQKMKYEHERLIATSTK